jgi:hypothetical protein
MRYLDPKNDLTFKKIFFNHPNILISLINGLMDFTDDRKVISIEYLNAELAPLSLEMKNTLLLKHFWLKFFAN